MEHVENGLLVLGYLVIGLGTIGTLGAIDSGSIDLKQALIQFLICVGVGLACFAVRWILCRFQK